MSNEVFGQRDTELLIAEEYHAPLKKIMEKLSSGRSWSGQFPFQRRSGEMFMALVSKSPLYEDGQLTGVITVSSDAAIFNGISSENLGPYQDHSKLRRSKMKRIQWHPPRPQIVSSVSNLVLMYWITTALSHFSFLFWFYFHFWKAWHSSLLKPPGIKVSTQETRWCERCMY